MVEIVSDSHEGANSDKAATIGSNVHHAEHALLKSQDCILFEVIVLLDLTEDKVGGEALDGVVELVFPEVSAHVTHQKVGPASILLSMDVLIMLDISETILQDGSVEKGVQGVPRCR